MFKAGDKVVCVNNGGWTSLKVGKHYTVKFLSTRTEFDSVCVEGLSGYYFQSRFKLVEENQMNKAPHKHCEIIKAWADGAVIQYKDGDDWYDVYKNLPTWREGTIYRVKPELVKTSTWQNIFPYDMGSIWGSKDEMVRSAPHISERKFENGVLVDVVIHKTKE